MSQHLALQSAIAIATGALVMAIALTPVLAYMGLGDSLRSGFQGLLLVLGCLIAATAGGYLTALLAPSHPSSHALGLIEVVLLAVLITALPFASIWPWWLQPVGLASLVFGIGTGTWLRSRQLRDQA